jgi:ABC-type branched-subunit amino acid transport system ATPase component
MLDVATIDTFYGETQAVRRVPVCVGGFWRCSRQRRRQATVLRSILGLTARRGDVRFQGQSVLGRPTHEIARLVSAGCRRPPPVRR